MRIKALTLWEPWASLVAIGEKRFETRDWGTKYRGWLAIHAAKRWRPEQQEIIWKRPYVDALHNGGFDLKEEVPFSLGCVVAVARLTGIYPADKVAQRLHALTPGRTAGEHELAFGDFRAGRLAWHLQDVVRLKRPVAARGGAGVVVVGCPSGAGEGVGAEKQTADGRPQTAGGGG